MKAASLFGSCPAYVLLAIVIADSISFADPDLWGHIRFGQAVLQAHRLIARDVYSYSAAGHPWHNHELGFELLLAISYGTLGVYGLRLLKLAFSATTIMLIAAAQGETGAGLGTQRWVLMLTALGLAPQMQFRPQLVSFALTAALIALLARSTYRQDTNRLWLAVPIMAVWANFHGGYVVGLGILAVYCATTFFSTGSSERLARRAASSLCLLCACTLATLVNPYGAGIWRTVAHTLSNPLTRLMVGEWRPMLPRFAERLHAGSPVALLYLFVFCMMAACLAAVILTPRGADLPLVAVAGLMIASALYATRNMALALIALSVPLTRHVAMLQEQGLAANLGRLTGRSTPDAAGLRENGVPAAAQTLFACRLAASSARSRSPRPGRPTFSLANQAFVAACALALALKSGLFSPSLRAAPGPFPAGVMKFMQRNSLKGNLLCNFAWGEYLIWHTAPASKVFIDGRYDTVYPQRVIRDYLSFYFGRSGAQRVLAAYPHDFAIVPRAAKAYGLLRRRSGWKLVYQDSGAAMFARAEAAAKLPAIDPSGATTEPAGADSFP
jgi:hypothetical protein